MVFYERIFDEFVDNAYESCWDENGFWPSRRKKFKTAEIVIIGCDYCYKFLMTNGLWGLLRFDWGKMFPEFAKGCEFLQCPISAATCWNIIENEFAGQFPRHDSKRKALVSSNEELISRFDEELSDKLYASLEREFFEDNLNDFFVFCCKKWNLIPLEEQEGKEPKKPEAWQRELIYCEVKQTWTG